MLTLKLTVHTNPIQECTIDQIPYNIGSDTDNDLVINDLSVDSFHARIICQQDQYLLVDLGSSSGTRIGNIQIQPSKPQLLVDESLVQIGVVILEVRFTQIHNSRTLIFAPAAKTELLTGTPPLHSTQQSLRLDAVQLHKSTSPLFGTTLLSDISLSILPKEFVVIAGVSGGGKSTLMDALNGQRHATSGKVLINGVNLYRHFNTFKKSIGYVPQDDIVHSELTVAEALNYVAQLRLPNATLQQRQQRLQEVLEQLQLTQRKHVPIQRLSGGQRKRVSIGVELITKPGLFFLDEATSGLDPGTELQIMNLLRQLANDGSTIILITHATKNVAIADLVVFLAKGGRLAYFGHPKLAFDYFKVLDFDAIYDKVERQLSPQQWQERFKVSAFYAKYITNRHSTIPNVKIPPVPVKPSFWQQWGVLCERNLAILLKNRMSLALMLAGAPILGSLNFALWKSDLFSTETGNANQAITMLFVAVIMAVMAGSLATMPEIAKETAIYRRERSAGLGVLPYLASKLQLAFLLALYQSAVLSICTAAAVSIPVDKGTFALMYITLFLASFGSMVLGLLASAIAPSQSVAPLLTILVLVPQVIFGGGILPASEFKDAGKLINYVMLTKYPFESLVSLSAFGADVALDPCWTKTQRQRKALNERETTVCDCYGKNVFQQCKFPGLLKVQRDDSYPVNVAKARLLIEGVHKNYGEMFNVNVIESWVKMLLVIGGITTLLLLAQVAKG
ncbi:ABC transporter ATP-binding protein/permease [Nostoc sp. MG11]|uniref:ABC transporter ATP-binding protein/permease n=1 Tax=Nostoc sp. MG11 TaxID=2721166 RepID=UPI00186750F6|nr:ABC transporter ATP-binding protein/permease [Nostoc sp. MG11]